MFGRKEQKVMVLPVIFLIIVIASIWAAVTISQAASKSSGDETGGPSIEGKELWHKGIKNKTFDGKHKDSTDWMEYKKAWFDQAVDEGLITEEQKDTLLDIFTRFHEGEITWEEKLELLDEAGIDLKQLFGGHGSKWKSDKNSSQAL